MDISPYIKLMVEKDADSLHLNVGSAPRLRLEKQEKAVGSNILSSEILHTLFTELTDHTQRLEFSIDKSLRFAAPLFGEIEFIIELTEQEGELSLIISKDKRNPIASLPVRENIQVFGEAPAEQLDILPYLEKVVQMEGSDLFLTSGSSVKTKVYGAAVELDSYLLTPGLTKSAAYAIMNADQIEEFEKTKDLDFVISLPDDSARFRVNVFYQRRTVGIVLRLIPATIPTTEELDLPEVLSELIMYKRGLLLIVGGAGSGKSTSLAAMINHRNLNAAGHILTIEDPVEFSHPNLKSIVNQREVGVDTASYARALKASFREAPDVILIGEIRDRETMEAALELANTGHLCISTLHANNANQALKRIINMFPQAYHKQLFMDLSSNLNAVISQRLIPDLQGKRCAAIEIMINTPHIANLILKGDLNEIKVAMKTSGNKGMKVFDDALLELYNAKRISLEETLKNADSQNDLEAKINFG
ncbi:twitching motility protein [Methyloprofundus sedimenti]|uniref:Twitching motility protein n=1 Tax=Methyloprofundus sedimenti TaxID=1420851 RepID=A0A1V8M5S6_9GAMM|nr:PilT/PilU family type 4a pilus ATPase [Methyloprofundus sedimenti]OQK16753.1 twitching motility protein [Methyloprofundus sedimenti]